MLKEINETVYVIQGRDGVVYETKNKSETKTAIRERREVTKNSRGIFQFREFGHSAFRFHRYFPNQRPVMFYERTP